MRSRRGRNEGSVTQRTDGTWEARISLGVVAGKRVRKSVYADTKAEALRELSRLQLETGRGYPEAEKLTVAEYLQLWLADTVDRTTKYKTRTSYRYVVNKYITPAVGNTLLSDLKPTSMIGFQRALERNQVPPPTARMACVILKLAIRKAAVDGVITTGNPFIDIRLNKPPTRELTTWTPADVAKFFEAAKESPLYAFFLIDVYCGPRHSEALGLRWTDFDFEARTLKIDHRLEEQKVVVPGQKHRRTVFFPDAPVKSKAGRRVFTAPEPVFKALAGLKERALAQGVRSEFLFMNSNGNHYLQRNVIDAFDRLCTKAGVPRIRIHDLRHTCATLARMAGQDLHSIMGQLGHSNITVTQLYAHISPVISAGFASAMERVLAPSVGGGQ